MIGPRQYWLAAVLAVLLEGVLLLVLAWSMRAGDTLDEQTERESPPPVAREEVVVLAPVMPPSPAQQQKLSFQLVETNDGQLQAKPDKPSGLISDRDTRAATEEESRNRSAAAMPTVTGITEAGLDLENQQFKDGPDEASAEAAKPEVARPEVVATPMPRPDEAEKPVEPAQVTATTSPPKLTAIPVPGDLPRLATTKPEDLLRPRPDNAKPDQQAMPPRPDSSAGQSGQQSQKIKRAIEGTLSQRGKASLDVDDTPLGRYLRSVSRVIERDWQYACRSHRDLTRPGFLRVGFTIDKDGVVTTARGIEARDGGEASKWFTLNAIKSAKLPPIPEDVVEMLENGQLEINFNFLFF